MSIIKTTGNFLANRIDRRADKTNQQNIQGLGGNDSLYGSDLDDTLDGGTGSDSMTGGAGNDLYIVDSLNDTVIEAAGGGTDTISATIALDLSASTRFLNVENLVANASVSSTKAITLGGNALNNLITGHAGVDTLKGYAGDDTLQGLAGNDLLDGGTGYDRLEGGAGNDSLLGGDGGDTLIGGLGRDTLVGGAGNDHYTVEDQSDILIEAANGGYDDVGTVFNFDLRSNPNIESVSFYQSSGTVHGWGNAGDNAFRGQIASIFVEGFDGQDMLVGSQADDTLDGGNGQDTLFGEGGNDLLIGGAGNDTYQMFTNFGQDTLRDSDTTSGNVDTLSLDAMPYDELWLTWDSTGALVIQRLGSTDRVTIEGWSTGAGVEALIARGPDGQTSLTRTEIDRLAAWMGGIAQPAPYSQLSAFDQAALNTIWRHGVPSAGKLITGTSGADTLTATGPADTLQGGGGGDLYVLTSPLNTVIDDGIDGRDTITVSENFDLRNEPDIEDLTLTGPAAVVGTGNFLGNQLRLGASGTLYGLDGDDTLYGVPGACTLYGGAGNDRFNVLLGTGNQAFGEDGDDTFAPSLGANTLDGGRGNDRFNLGSGSSLYIGGPGNDRYTIGGSLGQDTIREAVGTAGGIDSIIVGGLSRDQLWLQVNSQGALLIQQLGSSEQLTVENWQAGAIESISLIADGLIDLDHATLQALVDRMAGIPKPDRFTNLSAHEQAVLNALWLGETPPSDPMNTGTAGDDTLDGGSANDTLTGLAGNDSLAGGAGNDLLDGGTGDDELLGDDGDDTLLGGAGNDSLSGSLGRDVLNGGEGNDLLETFNSGADIFVLDGNFGQDTISSVDQGQVQQNEVLQLPSLRIEQLWVTQDDTTHSLTLKQLGTDNQVTVLNFNPWVVGQTAGVGRIEQIEVGSGADLVRISGQRLSEIARLMSNFTEPVDSVLNMPESVTDLLLAAWHEQTQAAGVIANGTAGADTLIGTDGPDSLNGGAGNDSLSGLALSDLLQGGEGDDRLEGGEGQDGLNGGNGNDTLIGGAGNDVMVDDQSGSDTYVFQSNFGEDYLDERRNAPTTEVDTLIFQDVPYDQLWLSMDSGGNITIRQLGTDSKVLVGGSGNYYSYGVLSASPAFEKLVARQGDSLVTLNVDQIESLIVRMASIAVPAHSIKELSANQLAGLESLWISRDPLKLVGTAGADLLTGQNGNDMLQGNAGNDTLLGNDGQDTLTGGAGDDSLAGGAGNDVLDGGSDNDSYLTGKDEDVITDADGSDTYVLRPLDNYYEYCQVDITDTNADGLADVDTLVLQATDYRTLSLSQANNTLDIWSLYSNRHIRIHGQARADGSTDYGIDRIQASAGGDVATLDTAGINEVISFLDKVPGGFSLQGKDAMNQTLAAIWQGRAAPIQAATAGNDALQGDGRNNILLGLKGDDTLKGGAGQDTLVGGDGNDLFINDDNEADVIIVPSDTGHDRIEDARIGATSNQDTLALDGWYARDMRFTVNAAGDLVINQLYWDRQVTLAGWAKAPAGELPGGIHAIEAGDAPPITRATVDRLLQLAKLYPVPSTAYGSAESVLRDNILAGNGSKLDAYFDVSKDTVYGFEGNDTLRGRVRDSVVQSGAGNDTLSFDIWGSDTLAGGAGNDSYTVRAPGDYRSSGEAGSQLTATIIDSGANGNTNTLTIDAATGYNTMNVYVQDFWFSRPAGTDDLLVNYGNPNLDVQVKDWFNDSIKPISAITLVDGSLNGRPAYATYTRSRDDVNQLVEQLAAFNTTSIFGVPDAQRKQVTDLTQGFWFQSPVQTVPGP